MRGIPTQLGSMSGRGHRVESRVRMPAVHATFRSQNHRGTRQESKALVVVISALQLALIVLVWLLALVPMALIALGATMIQALKPATVKTPAATPADS